MRTRVVRSPRAAARFIRAGEVVAFPTETVYGLGANLFDEEAIRKIFVAKERPADNPLIAHIATLEELDRIARDVTPSARALVARFFPGPLTVVLHKRPAVPFVATAGLATIGVRMPSEPIAHAFLVACGTPVVAPSANRSGRPSPTTWEAVLADLDGRIPCLLRGDQTRVGLESTVVDCTGDVATLLRAGAVPIEAILEVLPDAVVEDSGASEEPPRSPGLRHRHYAPRATVRVVATPAAIEAPHGAAFIGLDTPADPAAFALVRVCIDVDEYAHALFDFFRACDRARVQTIYCQSLPPAGLGRAINDRIRRAADAFLSVE